MNAFDSYRLLITPLSPVHIGTGESYEPTNYVINEGVLHEFDTEAVAAALTSTDREKLLGIANGTPDSTMIEAMQRFFYERRGPLMFHAVHRIPVLPGIARLYESRVGRTANREADGKTVINRLEIDRTSFNPVTHRPVLFGSSLKGAIRTALLNDINGGRQAQERKGLHEFQGGVFKYRDPNRNKSYFEQDPLRLVQLSDASYQGEPHFPATEVHLAVNRKKDRVVDSQGIVRQSQAETKDLYQILECVSALRYRSFSAQLNLQRVNGVLDERRGQRGLPAVDLRFDVTDIARACNEFYQPILEAENGRMRTRGYLNEGWDQAIQQLLAASCERMKRGEVFLLRVGRHSGAESVTVNGVRSIRIMKGKGERPEYAQTSKTLWLAADDKNQKQDLLPFGWLMVELLPLRSDAPDWPELRTICEPSLAAARIFAAKMTALQVELDEARAKAEARRREEEESARRRAEEEARAIQAEAERQTRLDAMTPEEREIETFRTQFENEKAKGGYKAGGIFDAQRLAFFKRTLEWQDQAARAQAASLLRETVKWSGWPGKKERKAEFKAWLEQLEAQ